MEDVFTDWSTLSLQLLVFAAAYQRQKGVKGNRTPDDYVRLAAADVKAGLYRLDPNEASVFAFMVRVIADRIDEDSRGSAA